MMLFAADEPGSGDRELCAIVRADEGVIVVRARVNGSCISGRHTAACRRRTGSSARSTTCIGITPEGHPRLEPLVRHAPEEGEVRLPEEEDDVRLEHRGAERLAGPGVFVIPYGPVRSGVFETAQFLVQTGGEDVAYCAQRLFFKRRGAERRICEVPLDLAVLVAERVSGTSSVAHALAFSHAVESLGRDRGSATGSGDPEDPGRARTALQPPRSHRARMRGRVVIRGPGPVRRAQGAAAPAGRRDRSATATCAARSYPAARASTSTREAIDLIGATLADWERDWRRVLSMLLRTDSFLDRLVSAGPLAEEDARDFGCVGPVARARASTSTRGATFPTTATRRSRSRRHSDGDAMARMEVRFQEVDSSLELIREAVASLRPGRIREELGRSLAMPRSAPRSRPGARRSTGSRQARTATLRLLQAASRVVRELRDLQPCVRLAGADRLLVHRTQPRALPGGVRRMIRWFLRGVSRRRLTTRYPRGTEAAPPAGFRARALLDPAALVTRPRRGVAAQACLRSAVARAAGPAHTRRGPLHRLRAVREASGRSHRDDRLRATSWPRPVASDSSSATDAREADIAAAASDGTVPPLAAHPPRRYGLRRRDRAGTRRAAEPLLRHAPARAVLHRQPASRRRPAGHRPGDAADGGAATAHLRGDARAARRDRRRDRRVQRQHLDRARSPRRGRPGARRSTSTSRATRRARSRSCTGCCWPPDAWRASAPLREADVARHGDLPGRSA